MAKTYLPTTSQTRSIDAGGKALGRVATEIAVALRGKDKASFTPNLVSGDVVVVSNAATIRYTGRKLDQKLYHHHTGYIGSLKTISLKQLIIKDPTDPLRRAVLGMLPNNRLRKELMKRLTIHAGQAKTQESTQ